MFNNQTQWDITPIPGEFVRIKEEIRVAQEEWENQRVSDLNESELRWIAAFREQYELEAAR